MLYLGVYITTFSSGALVSQKNTENVCHHIKKKQTDSSGLHVSCVCAQLHVTLKLTSLMSTNINT